MVRVRFHTASAVSGRQQDLRPRVLQPFVGQQRSNGDAGEMN